MKLGLLSKTCTHEHSHNLSVYMYSKGHTGFINFDNVRGCGLLIYYLKDNNINELKVKVKHFLTEYFSINTA